MTNRKPHRHRFPLSVIGSALRLDHRFSLSQHEVQALLHEGGVVVSHEKKAAVEHQVHPAAHRGTASLGGDAGVLESLWTRNT